jgi:4'-phosphopantetheinyl transferase
MNTTINARPTHRVLPKEEVHVWLASLDTEEGNLARLLDSGERNRAASFHFEKDRGRFIRRRGILRILLDCYLGVGPENIRLSYGAKAKPALEENLYHDEINFSLSHSDGMALYAFTGNREIGIDIERIREMPDLEQIAARFFSQRENKALQALPQDARKEAFFNCWTRKEAFVKATGDGLAYPLDGFDVSLAPGEPARLLGIAGDVAAASKWSLIDLKPATGFAAALAVKGRAKDIQFHRWAA